MANFPANLRCSSLALLAGGFEGRSHSSAAGNVLTVQATNRSANAQLRVSFRNITAANVATLRGHYEGEGTTSSWLLSAVLLDGADYAAELATTRWRYVSPPAVKDIDADVHDVELALEQVPANFWVERYVLGARPATVAAGEATRLIGPDQPPALWVSRLTTNSSFGSVGNAGPFGSIRYGANGETFQVFWFQAVSETGARVVVVKRAANGLVIWQRWTSAAIGNTVTTRDSFAPQVLPMADGGCVVAAQELNSLGGSTGTPSTRTTRMWRLSNTGSTVWEKDYAGVTRGPEKLAFNNGAIIIAATSINKDLAPTYVFNRTGPALVRISATDGSVLSARVYLLGTSIHNFGPARSDIIVLANNRIVFKCNVENAGAPIDVFFAEVSENTATVHEAHGYESSSQGGSNPYMLGPIARLPDGGYLSTNTDGFVRLASNFSIASQYTFTNVVISNVNAAGIDQLQMKLDDAGNGYFFNANFANSIHALGIGIAKLSNNGATLTRYSEVGQGSGAGDSRSSRQESYDIDLIKRTGVISRVRNASTCHVDAVGFLLEQPTSTAANNQAAASLNTGTCNNTMTVRGWENPSYTTTTLAFPFTHTPNVASNSGTFTLTASNASITMVDASASLTWVRSVLVG